MYAIDEKKGVSVVFAVFVLLVLSVLAIAVFSMLSTESESAAMRLNLFRIQGIAEAGLEIGARAVRDDKEATDGSNTSNPEINGYCGISFLESQANENLDYKAYATDNPLNVTIHGTGGVNPNPNYASMHKAVSGAYVSISKFDELAVNLLGGKLVRVRIVLRAARSSSSLSSDEYPRVRLEYTTDGTVWHPNPDAGEPTNGFDFTIDNTTWPTEASGYRYSSSIPVGWADIIKNDGRSFWIRVRRLDDLDTYVFVDWLALELVTEIDALTEPWGENTYITLPAVLGKGTIENILVADEAGKLNINYTPQILLTYLFNYNGIPMQTAATLAGGIVDYRENKKFDTIEEIKQIDGMTDEYFNLIDQDITVYSWVNNNIYVHQQDGSLSLAPVNINTASENVLKAMLKNALGTEEHTTEVVNAIVTQRDDAPFASMFSSYDLQVANKQSFAGFIRTLSFWWFTEYLRNRVLAVADGSRYVWYTGHPGDTTTVSFCYSSHTFLITSRGKSEDVERVVVETYGDIYSYETYSWSEYGSYALPTFIGDTSINPYWRMVRH